jgi:hypothetical protein
MDLSAPRPTAIIPAAGFGTIPSLPPCYGRKHSESIAMVQDVIRFSVDPVQEDYLWFVGRDVELVQQVPDGSSIGNFHEAAIATRLLGET